jgi:hypothetical protein
MFNKFRHTACVPNSSFHFTLQATFRSIENSSHISEQRKLPSFEYRTQWRISPLLFTHIGPKKFSQDFYNGTFLIVKPLIVFKKNVCRYLCFSQDTMLSVIALMQLLLWSALFCALFVSVWSSCCIPLLAVTLWLAFLLFSMRIMHLSYFALSVTSTRMFTNLVACCSTTLRSYRHPLFN